jgi:hypothetical protein
MTTLTVTSVTKDSPGAGQFTIVGTYADATHSSPSQRVTVGEFPSGNANWSRGHRLTDTVLLCVRATTQLAMYLTSWSKIAMAFENALTYIPKVNTQPSDQSCVHSSTAATLAASVSSELAATYQWQYESKASQTLTSDATAPANNDTVTIGDTVYTYKTTLTGAAYEVLIGASASVALDNLKSAINGTSGAGTAYGTGTVAHTTFEATTKTSTTLLIEARLSGTLTTATTETSSHLSWGAATVTGGGTWASATGTIRGCVYTNSTTASLTCTPTTTGQNGVRHRLQITNAIGTTTTSTATLTIT